jgi:glycine/D-amino acid oxidase-like deaminating enzyme
MSSRIGVGVMGLCLALYLVVVGQRAVLMLMTGEPIAIGIGVALLVLPLIGAWALVREMQFGFAADRLGRQLDAEGGMPQAETELTPSGRIARADADPIIERYAAAAEAEPTDWRARFRLGVVQDASGRRKDARASIREAIRLARG